MDPLQTIRELLEELASVEPNDINITDLLEDLIGWFTSGGYIPRIVKQGEHTYLLMDTNEDITRKTLIPEGDE